MKIAVINFSGNVGKSTIARHLLLPRIAGAELIAVESINSDESQGQALRGKQFGELQEYLHAYFSPSWTPFQADRGRHFSVIVDGISV